MKKFKEIQSTVSPSWLRARMEEHGLRNEDFKDTTGVTPQAVSEILNNTPGRPQRQSRVVLYFYFLLLERTK